MTSTISVYEDDLMDSTACEGRILFVLFVLVHLPVGGQGDALIFLFQCAGGTSPPLCTESVIFSVLSVVLFMPAVPLCFRNIKIDSFKTLAFSCMLLPVR